MVPHLILSPRNTDDMTRLSATAKELGWTVECLGGWRIAQSSTPSERLAIYGEPLFVRVVAAQIGRVMLEPPHDWLVHLPFGLLQRRVEALTLGELARLTWPRFLKPPDDKLFPAAVYESPNSLLARADLNASEAVLASDPVRFVTEFRVHLLRGKALSCSRYCVDGELDTSSSDPDCIDASHFAERVALEANESTPPAVVVDVGRLESGVWAVIEANPCFGAGIYEGDVAGVLDVLLEACRPIDESDPALAAFKYPVVLDE
ncbi:MAG: ATP-grasp domain-containing protein [Myxococcales bacterium]|nr:ATP-grasp domain-containing protein [Myxococcales bacterium]